MELRRLLLSLLIAVPVCADTLVLKDGSRLEGELKKTADGYDLTDSSGKVQHVKASQVASISVGKSDGASAASAMDRLGSLKRSVESLSDINLIIERYNRFIEQTKDESVVTEARKEVAIWQTRLDQGLVKVAGKWMTTDEQGQILASVGDLSEQARVALSENRNKDAEPLIKQAIAIDPSNPLVLYLQGALLLRQDKLPLARRSFEQVIETLPEHGASLNNIASILVQQKEVMKSMPYFDRAMLAQPDNKYILGNVLEVLTTLPENQLKNSTVQKVQKRFVEQDARLSQQMARAGWYRWGSLWIDQTKMDLLKKQEADARAKMDALQKEFDDAEARVMEITRRIESNDRLIRDLRDRSTYRDANGNIVRVPYPQSYYDAQNDSERLASERVDLLQQQNKRRQQAQTMKAELPTPKFNGVQHLIGIEGAPKPRMSDNPKANPLEPPPPVNTPATTQGVGPY